MTTFGVMKIHEFDDSIYYRVACQCGEPECDLTLTLSFDKKCGFLELVMYKNLKASAHWGSFWNYFDFIRVWKNKLKMIWIIATKGYIEVCEENLIQGEEHIDNFILALQQGKKFIVGKEKAWQEFLKSRKVDPKDLPNVKSVKS
jgi:hypothetical protein